MGAKSQQCFVGLVWREIQFSGLMRWWEPLHRVVFGGSRFGVITVFYDFTGLTVS